MDRKTLATALHEAERVGYIRTVTAGRFSPDKRRQRAAVYAVRWAEDAADGSPIPPDAPAAPAAERFTKSTSNGSRFPPEQRFMDSTTKKTASQKQQQNRTAPPVVVAPLEGEPEGAPATALLEGCGFTTAVARRLVRKHGEVEVRRQLAWLPRRSASRNVLGLLRRAIEESWAEPTARRVEPRPRKARTTRRRGSWRGRRTSTAAAPPISRPSPSTSGRCGPSTPAATRPSSRRGHSAGSRSNGSRRTIRRGCGRTCCTSSTPKRPTWPIWPTPLRTTCRTSGPGTRRIEGRRGRRRLTPLGRHRQGYRSRRTAGVEEGERAYKAASSDTREKSRFLAFLLAGMKS